MDIFKRALSTMLNGFLGVITVGILPLVLWLLDKPLVGQMLLGTPQASNRVQALVYGIFFVLISITIIGLILIMIWCVLGKEPLALEVTKLLVK
ncbi:hypothetical protein EELLY_v1c04150 [Entomoplasma ellychniae]|uniref:Uncharacterized protein n=1 Tax=Entomoplasma ellychniae TaxID=2114 RepID=A0A8E2QZI5_9MOLU|nr:hypothetical protein [Entomoplasma ellychniae]PPE04735.1 hypothetical protein EELLY_v1c04150 [Entomoplasma ellychniae]